MESSPKVYVCVTASFSEEGKLTPICLRWADGREFPIDKVTDVRPAAALKAGGQGDRYTIQVRGRQSHLFFERSTRQSDACVGRWFVEKK